MSYWALNAIFLGIVAGMGCLALIRSRRGGGMPIVAVIGALGILLLATAIFDNVMIGVGLVDYDPSRISGVYVGLAPIEDFAYPLAAAVLLPSLWILLGGRRDDRR
ncbi:MAG: lycopene cyclase [Microbacteriaceae bacterium]|nr:lycopene cyclase [Microbacteriaceae bacterium]